MLSLLKLHKNNLLFHNGTKLKSNIYDDILMICLFKLNQYQLCTKTQELIFEAIFNMFPSRAKRTLLLRMHYFSFLSFSFIWLAIQREHNIVIFTKEIEKLNWINDVLPNEISILHLEESRIYFISIIDRKIKEALR